MQVESSLFRHKLLVILCLWLAFSLRVWGLDFGLPYKFHPDEDKYVDAALTWHTTGQIEFNLINPPLFTYALVAAGWLWFALVSFTPSDEWLIGAYFFARLWSVFLSVLTISLVYVVGNRLLNRKAGLVAMALLSGLFLPAREAHFAVNDSAVTFFALLAIYFTIRLFSRNQLATYLTTGVTIGLATAAKLTGGLVVLSLLAAHSLLKQKKHLYVGLSFGVALVTFATVSAHIFWQWPAFLQVISDHLEFGATGYKGLRMAPSTGWGFYIDVLGWGIGWLMLLAVCLALVSLIFDRSPQIVVLVAFPLILFAYLGSQKIVFARFLLPAIPPLVVLVAIKLASLENHWSFWLQHQTGIWSLIIGLLLLQPLVNLIWFNHLLTLPDTREMATQWFVEEFPENTVVVSESYSLLPNTVFLDKNWPYDIDNLSGSRQMEYGVEHYLSHGAEVIVLSNFTFGRVREDSTEEEIRLKQLALLEEKATLIKTFNPYQANYDGWFYLDELYGPAGETLSRTHPGPLLKVYRLP